MITLHYRNKNITLPESFSELSGKQFIGIAGVLYHGGDFLKCQVKALQILANISRWKLIWMSTEFVDRARQYVNWIQDHEKMEELTDQLVPVYRGYHGPIKDFDNLIMKEFHFSELAYKKIILEKNDDALDELISVLYRPAKYPYDTKKDPDGDIRIHFNKNECDHSIRKICKWPAPVKYAIFIWYHNCRQSLINNNPLVFNDPEQGYESQFDTGLYGMMRSLAGDKLGPVEKIENMYVHTAMLEIGLIREEELLIKEQMESES